MSAVANVNKTFKKSIDGNIFWTNYKSNESGIDPVIFGLTDESNSRPRKPTTIKQTLKTKDKNVSQKHYTSKGHIQASTANKANYAKPIKNSRIAPSKLAKSQLSHPLQHPLSHPLSEQQTTIEATTDLATMKEWTEKGNTNVGEPKVKFTDRLVTSMTSKVALKDLCTEDKERVANLVRELAKVGSEKDIAMQERDEIQQNLMECQNLLTQYQRRIEADQDKLVQSMCQQTSLIDVYQINQSKSPKNTCLPIRTSASNLKNKSTNPGVADDCVKLSNGGIRVNQELEVINHNCDDVVKFNGTEVKIKRTPYKVTAAKKLRSTPLAEPVLSSTQKSMSIKSTDFSDRILDEADKNDVFGDLNLNGRFDMNGDVENCVVQGNYDLYNRNRVHMNNNTHMNNDNKKQMFRQTDNSANSQNKKFVGFIEYPGYNPTQEVVLHSPQQPINFQFSDKRFVEYYRKLDPETRKMELLRQRADLEKERSRLQIVLNDQTTKWQQKQDGSFDKQIVQTTRFEQNGRFLSNNNSQNTGLNNNYEMHNRYKNGCYRNGEKSHERHTAIESIKNTDKNHCFIERSNPNIDVPFSFSTPRDSDWPKNNVTNSGESNTTFHESFKIVTSQNNREIRADDLIDLSPLHDISLIRSTSPILAGSSEIVNDRYFNKMDGKLRQESQQNGISPNSEDKGHRIHEDKSLLVNDDEIMKEDEDSTLLDNLLSLKSTESMDRNLSLIEIIDELEKPARPVDIHCSDDLLNELLDDDEHLDKNSNDNDEESRVLEDIFFL